MKSPWEAGWKKRKELGEGGHGRTSIVYRRDGTEPTWRVLKVLKKPKDPERRARLAREVAALRKLDCPGVPRLIEDNCDAANNTDDLYAVMEYVPGPTLEQYMKADLRPLDKALAITEAIVMIVECSHRGGLLHRDIKPDNIVLRDGYPTKPTLLDFGQSVDVQEEGHLTETEQQLGNRFLGLPEHRTPGDDKRDARADITLCAGLLFYMLTGRQPMTLEDGEGRSPHKRPDVQAQLAAIEDRYLVPLTRLFDSAFRPRVSERPQTIDDLRMLLASVRHGSEATTAMPAPTVESLWTLHMVGGQPDSLYIHHRLVGESDLKPFSKETRLRLLCATYLESLWKPQPSYGRR